MAHQRLTYPTDLTDEEWQILKPLLPPDKSGGRPRKYPMREVLNAIQYVLRGGCAWRLMPHDLPQWQTAYQTFRPADLRDAAMAPWLLATAHEVCRRLQHIWADRAYRGQRRRTWIEAACGWSLEIVQRPGGWGWYPTGVEPPPIPAFTVLPRRWVVERTIAWIGRYRRLSKEYEYLPESRETMIYLAMSRLMLRRLARQAPYGVPSPQRQGLRGLARAF